MEPMTMALLMQAIPAVAQGITGLVQGRRANKMGEGLVDPTYAPPESAMRALANAENLSYSRNMAGQANMQNEIEQQYNTAASDVIKTATSGVDALSAITGLNRNALRSQNQLAITSAQDYERRQQNLRSELNQMARYEDKAFDINEMQPFLRDSAAISALQNAKQNNLFQSLKGLSNMGSTAYASKAYEDSLGMGGNVKSMAAPSLPNPNYNNYSLGFDLAGNSSSINPTDFSSLASLLASNASGVYSGNSSINTFNK